MQSNLLPSTPFHSIPPHSAPLESGHYSIPGQRVISLPPGSYQMQSNLLPSTPLHSSPLESDHYSIPGRRVISTPRIKVLQEEAGRLPTEGEERGREGRWRGLV